MLRDKAVKRIQRRLGFRDDQAEEIIEAMQDAQFELERKATLPWFLISELSSITTQVDEHRIPLPEGFLREVEESGFFYFNPSAENVEDEWLELAKDDEDELRKLYPGAGAPKGYCLIGPYFMVFPRPDAIYTIKLKFFEADDILDSNIENSWLEHAHDLIIASAGLDLAASTGDEKRVILFTGMLARAEARFEVEMEARDAANRRFVMGGVD